MSSTSLPKTTVSTLSTPTTTASGAPLWHVSLLQSGETPLSGAIQPVQGVTSTPVIDPKTNTLYVVSAQTSTANRHTFRLHALDITTGAEKFGGPVALQASLPGTGSGGTTVTLTTSCVQRAALLLANGNVYFGFGGCVRGWLLAYSASTLAQVGVFTSSPNLNGENRTPAPAASGWAAVAPSPTAPATSMLLPATARGMAKPPTADSILKFSPTLQLEDYFTPDDYQFMDCNDDDLGSGGLLLIPGTTELLAGGKTGTLYLVNSTNMGHEQANDAGATQTLVWGQGLSNGATYSATCNDSAGIETANVTSYEIFGTSAYLQQLRLPRRHARRTRLAPPAFASSSTPEPSLPALSPLLTSCRARAALRRLSPPTAPPAASCG